MGTVRRKFLLHTCCAPCGIAVIDELRQSFDLTVYFYNPNIYPIEEYEKRKAEVVRVCTEWSVPMIDGDYENERWVAVIKGLEKEKERGYRCSKCIALRLERTAQLAKERGDAYFGTTLSMSRRKSAAVINPIGRMLAEKFGVPFHEEDWKKKGRWDKGRKMANARNIYIQNYCGCIYSLQALKKSTAK